MRLFSSDVFNRQAVRLLIVVVLVAGVWGVLLPRLADTPQVRARTRWLEEHQIDPAAMYYTELPMMERVLQRGD